MRVPRFVVRGAGELHVGDRLTLDATESSHLHTSLRRNIGARIELVDLDRARVFRCEVAVADPRAAECVVREERAAVVKPTCTLLLGLPENPILESVVEKAVEIGVAKIMLFGAERSQNARARLQQSEKLLLRLERIAIAALKQSGAALLPPIHHFPDLSALLDTLPPPGGDRRFVGAVPPEAGSTAESPVQLPQLTDLFSRQSENPVPLQSGAQVVDSYVLIGPEGGLTDAEDAAALSAAFMPVSLGPQVLRTETAAVAALTLLRLLGDRQR